MASYRRIGEFKITSSPAQFCELVQTPYLTEVLTEAYSYCYSAEPDYNKLRFFLTKQLLDMDVLPNTNYSWFNLSSPIPFSEELNSDLFDLLDDNTSTSFRKPETKNMDCNEKHYGKF